MSSDEILNILKKEGIEFVPKFGFGGAYSKISLFGMGKYYEGNFNGGTFQISPCYIKTRNVGTRITFYFHSPLNLGIYITWNVHFYSLKKESPPLFAKRFNSLIKGTKIWTTKPELTQRLFTSTNLWHELQNIVNRLDTGQQSFLKQASGDNPYLLINDDGITVYLSSYLKVDPIELFNLMHQVVLKIEGSDLPIFSRNRSLAEKIFKIVLWLILFLLIALFLLRVVQIST